VGVDTLELIAVDCDVIVRGVIADSCFVGSKYDSNHNVRSVKLRVLEKLKGECSDSIGIRIAFPRKVHPLRRDRQKIVAFLRAERLELPAVALGFQTRKGLWEDTASVLSEDMRKFSSLTFPGIKSPTRFQVLASAQTDLSDRFT